MNTKTTQLCGWGRYPVGTATLTRPELYRDFMPAHCPEIVRGLGRSYGDAALNRDGRVTLSERINRFLKFNPDTGELHAEAGLALGEILMVAVPRGWFLPVTPGTQYVSLGGCVAADVHGKNHITAGSFSRHVQGLELVLASGEHVRCSATQNPDLFWATMGGMGLTGMISEVALQLQRIESAYLIAEYRAAPSLDAVFSGMESDVNDSTHRVAWIDGLAMGASLGRGVIMAAHHARLDELPMHLRGQPLTIASRRLHRLPVDLPPWVLNRWSIGTFNNLYYWRHGRTQGSVVTGYEKFFYPLDSIANWNRMYGKPGFLQYQCVIPERNGHEGIRALLGKIAESQRASFLAVLKRLGGESQCGISFPVRGYTLALDFPLRGSDVFRVLESLDDIVLRHGGRVYLAKDARLTASTFRAMYPRYHEWLAVKRRYDPDGHFVSDLARRLRLGGDA